MASLTDTASAPMTIETTEQNKEDGLEVTTTAQHEHSNSMVTIRLSDNQQPPPTSVEEAGMPGTDDESEEQTHGHKHNDSESIPVDVQINGDEHGPKPVVPTEERLNRSSIRASRVRFDMQDNTREESEALFQNEEEQLSPSQTSSKSSFSPIAIDDGTTLEAEIQNHAARIRSQSSGSSDSGSVQVDWAELDRTEEQEQRDDATDESTAFLLAMLEKENNALAVDPKAGLGHARSRSASRPPSFHQIKKLVIEPPKPSLRYSMLPTPPPMTELEFWSALVRDYAQTALRLPTLTSNKIRSGIPPPLRGVVWQSIAGARDSRLEDEYMRLCVEPSPYGKAIDKDVGRSFPGVDMFRDPNGDGQRMLTKVLNAFSLWDQEIGYCQGLGFVVGPLLMHMGDKEAFCILVRCVTFQIISCGSLLMAFETHGALRPAILLPTKSCRPTSPHLSVPIPSFSTSSGIECSSRKTES